MNKNLCIVLSSGTLLDHRYGHIIDKCDDVVRFNDSPIDIVDKLHFKQIAGLKETHRSMWNKHEASAPSLIKKNIKILWTTPETEEKKYRNSINIAKLYQESCSKLLHKYMHSSWKGWCTSGLLVGYWAINQNYEKIKVFGYHENKSRPIHYYGEGLRISYDENSRRWPEHNFNIERIAWKFLSKNASLDFF